MNMLDFFLGLFPDAISNGCKLNYHIESEKPEEKDYEYISCDDPEMVNKISHLRLG